MGLNLHNVFWELNEYGIIYHRKWLLPTPKNNTTLQNEDEGEKYLDDVHIIRQISWFIYEARDFYQRCQYSGNIEVVAKLRQVYGQSLKFTHADDFVPETRLSVESEISASAQCLPRSLQKADEYTKLLFRLVDKLFWGLNVYPNESWKQRWQKYVAERCEV